MNHATASDKAVLYDNCLLFVDKFVGLHGLASVVSRLEDDPCACWLSSVVVESAVMPDTIELTRNGATQTLDRHGYRFALPERVHIVGGEVVSLRMTWEGAARGDVQIGYVYFVGTVAVVNDFEKPVEEDDDVFAVMGRSIDRVRETETEPTQDDTVDAGDMLRTAWAATREGKPPRPIDGMMEAIIARVGGKHEHTRPTVTPIGGEPWKKTDDGAWVRTIEDDGSSSGVAALDERNAVLRLHLRLETLLAAGQHSGTIQGDQWNDKSAGFRWPLGTSLSMMLGFLDGYAETMRNDWLEKR